MNEAGQLSDDEIVEWAVRACFGGLAGPAAAPLRVRARQQVRA